MPVVSSFDGVNRRIYLDASVAGSTWSPLDVYIEYLAYRRDTEQFRGFDPLIVMKGGEPKTAVKSAPRFLQMLTDGRGITTKFIVPDSGPYRTVVDGEISTDVPDSDPEPFDVSGLTTSGIIIDYKPAEAEIIKVQSGSGLSASQDLRLTLIEKLLRNKFITDPDTGVATLFDDDGTTALLTSQLSEDAAGTQSYRGQGSERRERFE